MRGFTLRRILFHVNQRSAQQRHGFRMQIVDRFRSKLYGQSKSERIAAGPTPPHLSKPSLHIRMRRFSVDGPAVVLDDWAL